jgi:Na+-transporting NADH:ubiquinone oxidoreductase subunit C
MNYVNNILISIILLIFTTGCNQTTTEKPPTEKQLMSMYIKDIGYFIDSTYTGSTDLSLIIDFKYMDINKKIKECSFEKSIEVYSKLIYSDSCTEFPIFEVKNSNISVLIVGTKNIWANIWAMYLIDRDSKTIRKVEIYYETEVAGLGVQISNAEFEKQFINLPIQISGHSFGLKQDEEIIIQGENIIDGISGATLSSKAIIEISNELESFNEYLYQ